MQVVTSISVPRYDQMLRTASTKAERALAREVLQNTEPYVPAKTGIFSRRARAIGQYVVYSGDAVNYLYEGHVMVNAKTGKGPPVIPGIGPRWRRGTKLRKTDRPLTYTRDMHAKAGDHWMERSQADNYNHWVDFATEVVSHDWGQQ